MFTIIAGTNRRGALTLQVARAAAAQMQSLGKKVEIIDLAAMPPEIFTPDAYAQKPEAFAPYQAQILETTGIFMVIPEYNGSFPGALKFFIDMLQFPESLVDKPVGFIGLSAGQFGAARAIDQMTSIVQYRSAHVFGKKLYLSQSHNLNIEGTQLGREEIQERFERNIEEFCHFAEMLASCRD